MDPARRRKIAFAALVAALLVAAVPWPRSIAGDAQVLPAAEVPVRAAVSGLVTSVEARSGQRVRAGQLLAGLEPDALGGRLATLRAQAEQARLGEASAGRDDYARRIADLERQEVEARLVTAEDEQARSQLVAPVTGYVLTPNLGERVGLWLEPGEVFCQVSPLDTLRVEVSVPETDVARIRPGQTVRIKVLGFPDRQFRGRVREVALEGESPKAGKAAVFGVIGWVANPGAKLRSGMTGRARIDVGRETLLWRWARGLWRSLRMGFWL